MRLLLGLVASLVTLVVLAVLALVGLAWWQYDAVRVTAVGAEMDNRLRVPPLAESHRDQRGRRVFELDLRRGRADLGQGTPTETWGVNGSYLGPTLRADRGEHVRVEVTNRVGETTSLHWHGMHLPSRMDGGPHQPVAPGETWTPHWLVDQPAATLWYHPHPHGATADHVYRGLAGMFLVDDPVAGRLPLPDTYGVDDVPVIIQDKRFHDDGQLDSGGRFGTSVGVLGDELLVNGTPDPFLPVATERVRLRLLNASNARTYSLGLSDGAPLTVVATDGGLLPHPLSLQRLLLSPGERAEVVVTSRPGERVRLRSHPFDVAGSALQRRFSGGDDTFDVLELRAADRLKASPEVPDRLVRLPAVEPGDVETVRSFDLTTPRINGQAMDMGRIDARVRLGSAELWRVRNLDGEPHNFHVHDVQFRVVEVDGAPPPAYLRGRKDTVLVPANTEVVLRLRFEDYADARWPYMFHCHLLQHEDQGMMGQFVVVAGPDDPDGPGGPGALSRQPSPTPAPPHRHQPAAAGHHRH